MGKTNTAFPPDISRYPLTPSIPYPIPMPTDRRMSSHCRARTPAPEQRPQAYAAGRLRVQGVPCLAAVPGGCFIHPFPPPGPYLRRALGGSAVVSRRIRVIAAPRSSNPRSRFNLKAATRSRRQNRDSNLSCAESCRDSTSIQPQSCTARFPAPERRSQARESRKKTRRTKRFESNSPGGGGRRGVRGGTGPPATPSRAPT